MAVATGVRADIWQTAVPSFSRRGGGAVPGQRGEAVGAVGLGRPDGVEAEVLGRGQRLGHPDGRSGEPVPEDQTELEIVSSHGRTVSERQNENTF